MFTKAEIFKYAVIVLAIIILLALYFLLTSFRMEIEDPTFEVNSFEECADAGYPVMESFPEQCRAPDGRSFTKEYPPEVLYNLGATSSDSERDEEAGKVERLPEDLHPSDPLPSPGEPTE